MFSFGQLSRGNLLGVHPDLVLVVSVAITISEVDFSIVDGARTIAEQRGNIARGVSKTMDSRHLPSLVEPYHLLAHAIDVVPWVDGRLVYDDTNKWLLVAKAMKDASDMVKVPVENGFDMWKWDRPHWQLPTTSYPKVP